MKDKIPKVLLVLMILFLFSCSGVTSNTIKISKYNSNLKESNSEATAIQQKWALVIGVPTADYAPNDAKDFKNVLISNGWMSSHITCLTGLETTKVNIIAQLNLLSLKETSDDIVIFYFSGHGRRGSIASLIVGENAEISANELDSIFNMFDTNKLVLIFDCCMSGSMGKNIRNPALLNNDFDGFFSSLAKPGRIILTSCGRFQLSYGFTPLQNAIFTYYLINGFNGYGFTDSNMDGYISVKEAFRYAMPRTILRAGILHHQSPRIYDGCIEPIKITQI